jgi:hypothetical protein
MRRLRLRLGWVATNQENMSMHSLLRPAVAAVMALGLSAGAADDARADVAYDSFGKWFDAIVTGDHSGPRSHGVNRCSESYSGCGGNGHPAAHRPDRDEASDRGRSASGGGGSSNTDSNGDAGYDDGDDGDGDRHRNQRGKGHSKRHGKGHNKDHGKDGDRGHKGKGKGKDGDRGHKGGKDRGGGKNQ